MNEYEAKLSSIDKLQCGKLTPNFKQHAQQFRGTYEDVSKSFRTGGLEREPQMIQLSATRGSYIAIL
jgi:hypothetical protein